MRADFHIHSDISDGSYSINEILDLAAQKSIDMVAITDHDTLAHRHKILLHPKVKAFVGIEISAFDFEKNMKAHVLGYGIKYPKMVEQFTLPTLIKRQQNSLEKISILKRMGYFFNIEEIAKADGKYIYKQHILEYLKKTEQIDQMFGSLYQTVFKNGGICSFDIDYVDVRDAVDIIHKAGGYAVLAHPGQQENYHLLEQLAFDGVEYGHHSNDEPARRIIKDIADQRRLFLTAGSDFHGIYAASQVSIGDNCIFEKGQIYCDLY